MPLQSPHALPADDVPEDHLPVPARADHPVALQAHGVDGAFVPIKSAVQLKGVPIPDPDQGVFRAASPES